MNNLPPIPDSHICTKTEILEVMKDDIKEVKLDVKTLLAYKNAGDRDLKNRVSELEAFNNKIIGVLILCSAIGGWAIDQIAKLF